MEPLGFRRRLEWDKGWEGFLFDPGLCQKKWWSIRCPEDKDISHTLITIYCSIFFFLIWFNLQLKCIWSCMHTCIQQEYLVIFPILKALGLENPHVKSIVMFKKYDRFWESGVGGRSNSNPKLLRKFQNCDKNEIWERIIRLQKKMTVHH